MNSVEVCQHLLSYLPEPSENVLQVLREKFRIQNFFPLQWAVVHASLQGFDQVGVFSTNFGKSLLYQFPAEYGGGIVIVVTPTICLMRDQVASMQNLGISACLLGSAQPNMTRVVMEIEQGYYNLVYASPEYLTSDKGRNLIYNIANRVSLLAVDEVHCIPQWKYFRPQFRLLGDLRKKYLPHIPILAVTASATPEMISEITETLQLKFPVVTKSSLDRPNIYIRVKYKNKGIAADIKEAFMMQERLGPTIVYCATKLDAEMVNRALQSMGMLSGVFHSSAPDRANVQDRFMQNELQVVVATSSFGMGVNKKDVHCVIHYGPTWTFEDYFQQIGRAGRDGHQSYCIAFYRDDDFLEPWVSYAMQHKLQQVWDFFKERNQCRRKMILNLYGEEFGDTMHLVRAGYKCCDNCDRRI